MINVGLSLRVAIAKKDMKPSEFAKEYGWSRQRACAVLKQKSVSTELLQQLADHFGMTVGDFIKLGQ